MRKSVECAPASFTIAGYTGRDQIVVRRHIEELAAEGIPPPPSVPAFYPMPIALLTLGPTIAVASARTSGEVEPVVIVDRDGTTYLGIGSDHTDRDRERDDIAASKRSCPKPLGAVVAAIDAAALHDGSLDALTLESWVDAVPYQRGTFAAITRLGELIAAAQTRALLDRAPYVMFCGTVPLLNGSFAFGRRFEAAIGGPPLAQPLRLVYETEVYSPVSRS
ncbi:MAG: DUF2848 family protein [Vulcanimicrobiaceae bacterium]